MKTLERIKKLIDNGYESQFIALCDELEDKSKKVVLHVDLQAKLEELGDTPIAEPEKFVALNKGKMEFALALLTEDEIKKYSASEVGDYIYAAEQKITQLQNEDGVFKSTPNTENCDLPNFIEAGELMKLGQQEVEYQNKLQEALAELSQAIYNMENAETAKDKKTAEKEKEAAEKKHEKAVESFTDVIKKFSSRAFEISKIDEKDLSPWEKSLVVKQVYMTALNASYSAMGKRLKI